jgi:DNA repair exonuclease SbcCD nuclease subunit
MSRIFVTGDTHGVFSNISYKKWPESRELTKEDYLIVLGDFGLIWETKDRSERYWSKFLNDRPFTVLFLPGNHENYQRLFTEFKTVKSFGDEVLKVYDNVFMLKRGHSYNINGKSILALGGAESTDKGMRQSYRTWWPEEVITSNELSRLNRTIKNKYDYILTHTCPDSILKDIIKDPYYNDPTGKVLDTIKDTVSFKHWYFGHFHTNKDIGKYTCLFRHIRELY